MSQSDSAGDQRTTVRMLNSKVREDEQSIQKEKEEEDEVTLKKSKDDMDSSKNTTGSTVPLPPPISGGKNADQEPGAYAVGSPAPLMTPPSVVVSARAHARGSQAPSPIQDPTTSTVGCEDACCSAAVEEGLAQAMPVSAPTGTAEPVDKKKKDPPKTSHTCAILVAVLLLVTVVVAAVATTAFMLLRSDEAEDKRESSDLSVDRETAGPAEAPDSSPVEIMELLNLPNYTLAVLQYDTDNPELNVSSPQQKAYEWMQQDPWLETYSEKRLLQRFALATVFFATFGSNWTQTGGGTVSFPSDAFQAADGTTAFYSTGQGKGNGVNSATVNLTSKEWLSYKSDECAWFSLATLRGERTCVADEDDYSFYYNYLDVEDNNLVGTIPPEVGLLTDLKGLFLGKSSLEGPIITQLGQLTKLRDLDLGGSSLTGTIPTEIGLLSDTLQNLVLLGNQLTGSFPTAFWQLSRLQQILTGRNELTGTLPHDVGNLLPRLKVFMMFSNNLEGTLPTSFGLMTDLLIVDIAENQFTGTLPSELGKLTLVTRLFLANNDLSGSIPSELALLTGLTKLNLQGNENMSGPFPPELRYLNSTLTTLQLHNTDITGTIPEELCSIKKLKFECSEMLCGCDCPC